MVLFFFNGFANHSTLSAARQEGLKKKIITISSGEVKKFHLLAQAAGSDLRIVNFLYFWYDFGIGFAWRMGSDVTVCTAVKRWVIK